MKKILQFIILINASFAYAQVADNNVQSLLAAENYFSSISIEKGIKKAYLTVSDDATIIFRPSPVPARSFYKKIKNDSTYLSWSPSFARISKGGDWGFTSGPFISRLSKESSQTKHGQYLSVWKKNKKGIWKLAIDAGIDHSNPKMEPKLDFLTNEGKFFKQHSVKRQQQRADIVLSTDKLFSLSLKTTGINAYNEFANDNIHILFPDAQPVIGKKNAIAFFNKQKLRITSENIATDRAFGGDYAYTYGNANLARNGKEDKFTYIRIWQLSEDHTWNVLFELFSPSESTDEV
ncbi:MAG TPA: hypothetical protein VNI52_09455 [Sphingobacteriaceae bacterium]|nr:hypothetical protein [Sphingobacteriaceae bacterium]